MSEFNSMYINEPEQHPIGEEFIIGQTGESDDEELLRDMITEATEGEL